MNFAMMFLISQVFAACVKSYDKLQTSRKDAKHPTIMEIEEKINCSLKNCKFLKSKIDFYEIELLCRKNLAGLIYNKIWGCGEEADVLEITKHSFKRELSGVFKNTDPVKPDSLNSDLMKSDPINPDPLKTNFIKTDPLNRDILNPDPLNPDLMKTDPLNTDLMKSDPMKSDPINADSVKSDLLNTDTMKSDPLNTDLLNAYLLNTDPLNTFSIKSGKFNIPIILKKHQVSDSYEENIKTLAFIELEIVYIAKLVDELKKFLKIEETRFFSLLKG